MARDPVSSRRMSGDGGIWPEIPLVHVACRETVVFGPRSR